MAAQHGDGCTAGGDGYASNRTAGSDDSEDRCCVDDPAAMSHEDVKLSVPIPGWSQQSYVVPVLVYLYQS